MTVESLGKPVGSSQRTRTKNEKKAGRGTRMCFCMEVWHMAGCSPWGRKELGMTG